MNTSPVVTKIFGPADTASLAQLQGCLAIEPETALGALMADHHKGYSMPIGGVVAYRNHISPSGVGFDIGCGNLYEETDINAVDVDIPAVMTEISQVVSFGMGRNNRDKIDDHPVYSRLNALSLVLGVKPASSIIDKGRNQLGTVGSGNHYVDLFENRSNGKLGVGVHFGSRGVGHTVAKGYMAVATGGNFGEAFSEGGMDAPPLVLRLDMPSGRDYEACMNIALDYAYAGREWVVSRIVKGILQAKTLVSVHNNHNYAARETINGQEYSVHRKGATPAYPGQFGFVGATMGEDAVIVRGIDTEEARLGLSSTVHGAGRVMSRTQAAGKFKTTKSWACKNYRNCTFSAPLKQFSRGKDNSLPKCPTCGSNMDKHGVSERVRDGLIDFAAVKEEIKAKGIYLIGGDADEAPGAYKRLEEVLAYHSDAIEVITYLRPLGVIMAGREVKDDYKGG